MHEPSWMSKPEQDATLDPEDDLMQKILDLCKETDLSPVHSAGCCQAVGTLLLSQAYNLTQREKEYCPLPFTKEDLIIEP